jgi:hypothetical protein
MVLHQVTTTVGMRVMANVMCRIIALSTPMQPIVVVSYLL